MAHNRKLAFSGISLTMARPNRHDLEVMDELRDELEELMISSGYLEGAPFTWVGLALRYGLENEDKPHFLGINKKHGDLALGIELDTNELIAADRDELKRLFTVATLKSLIQAGKKHKLPVEALEELLGQQEAA